MMRRSAILGFVLGSVTLVQGCVAPVSGGSSSAASGLTAAGPAPQSKNFNTIVGRIEPIAERICRDTPGTRQCDYKIVLDTRPDQPPNAFQTRSESGRPVLVVNQTLLDQLRNGDEIAFVVSHEAAHHISDHIPKQEQNTYATALAAGLAAAALGGSQSMISSAQELGAYTGARVYSKNFELEADQLGARIAYLAGYDPMVGVQYFARSRDPGDQFLGTHPPNAQRIKAVNDVMKELR